MPTEPWGKKQKVIRLVGPRRRRNVGWCMPCAHQPGQLRPLFCEWWGGQTGSDIQQVDFVTSSVAVAFSVPLGRPQEKHPGNDIDCKMRMPSPLDSKIKRIKKTKTRPTKLKAPTLQLAATNANAHEKSASRVSGSPSPPLPPTTPAPNHLPVPLCPPLLFRCRCPHPWPRHLDVEEKQWKERKKT